MKSLNIPLKSKEIMINQALSELPDECCGLLLGKNGTVFRTIPMKNTDPSPDAYFMDPVQQVTIFTGMEKRGEQLIGIYHSHPNGPSIPSAADLKTAFHPDAVYIIVSLEDPDSPELRAFMINNGDYTPVKLI